MSQNELLQNRVAEIFYELRDETKLIGYDRVLFPKPGLKNIASHVFEKKIFYDPVISTWPADEIIFCLLHEEGHIVKGHDGRFLTFLLAIIGIMFIAVGIIIVLFFSVLNLSLLLISWGIFSSIFCIRLSSKPLEMDEFASDEYAAEIMKQKMKILKPSAIISNALRRLHELNVTSDGSKNQQGNFLHLLKVSLFEDYYPTDQQRIANIQYQFDTQ